MSATQAKEYILNKPGADPEIILRKDEVLAAFAVGALPARLALPVLAAQTREFGLNQFPSLSGITDEDSAARENFLEANLAATQQKFRLDDELRGPGFAAQLKQIAETTGNIAKGLRTLTVSHTGMESLLALARRDDLSNVTIALEPNGDHSTSRLTISFPPVEAGLSDVQLPLDPRISKLTNLSLAAQEALAGYSTQRLKDYLENTRSRGFRDLGEDVIDSGRDMVLNAAHLGIEPNSVLDGFGLWRTNQGWDDRAGKLTTGATSGLHLLNAGFAEGLTAWAESLHHSLPTTIFTSRELDRAGADYLRVGSDGTATAVSVKSGDDNRFFSVQDVAKQTTQPVSSTLQEHREEVARQLTNPTSRLRSEAAKLTPAPLVDARLAQVPLAVNTHAWKQIFAAAGMEDEELANTTLNAAIKVRETPAGDERLNALERAMRLAMEVQSRGAEPIRPDLDPREQAFWERYLPPQPVSPVQAENPQAPLPPKAAGPDIIVDNPLATQLAELTAAGREPTTIQISLSTENQAGKDADPVNLRALIKDDEARQSYVQDVLGRLKATSPSDSLPGTFTSGELVHYIPGLTATALETGLLAKVKPRATRKVGGVMADTYTLSDVIGLVCLKERGINGGLDTKSIKKLLKAIEEDLLTDLAKITK